MIDLTLLAFGIAGLWIGTLLAVRGAVGLSERFGLSHGFIGLAVLSVGTDLPELVVAVNGSIRQLGGVERTNSFTKLYLAIFGQYRWDDAPAVPPELILFPNWFPFNIYEMSSWSRAIVVPLGSTEQHGPNGLIGTDALCAQAVAERGSVPRS